MKTLEDLKAIADAATPGPYKADYCGDVFSVAGGQECWHCGEDNVHDIGTTKAFRDPNTDATYIATFNPELVKAMIEEIETSRAIKDYNGIEYHEAFELNDKYDKVRERLDAILRGGV